MRRPREQAPERYLYENYNNNIYKVIHPFPNLITKESYNWWVTRRVWGFRQQISKAKYLKISQNVDRKYLEASGEHRGTVQKNISKCRLDISGASGEHRGTVQNDCETLQVSAIKGSGYV